MNYLKIISILFLVGCANGLTRKVAQEANTQYYFGEVVMSSADGKIPYGKTISLVKRTIEPTNDTITELVLQPPRSAQQKPKDINTTLKRIGRSNIFTATDGGHTFTGEMAFEGSEWAWDKWIYAIKLTDGSKLTGSGLLDSSGIKTQKTFFKPDGTASVLLKEDLKLIDSDEYEKRHKQIIGP